MRLRKLWDTGGVNDREYQIKWKGYDELSWEQREMFNFCVSFALKGRWPAKTVWMRWSK